MTKKDGQSGAGRQELTPEQRVQYLETRIEEALAKLSECKGGGPWSAFHESLEGLSAVVKEVRGPQVFALRYTTWTGLARLAGADPVAGARPIAGFRNPELGVMYGVAVTNGRIPELREGLERLLAHVRDGAVGPTIIEVRRVEGWTPEYRRLAEEAFLDDNRWLDFIERVAVGEGTAPLEKAVMLLGSMIRVGALVLRDDDEDSREGVTMALADMGWRFPRGARDRAQGATQDAGAEGETGAGPAEGRGKAHKEAGAQTVAEKLGAKRWEDLRVHLEEETERKEGGLHFTRRGAQGPGVVVEWRRLGAAKGRMTRSRALLHGLVAGATDPRPGQADSKYYQLVKRVNKSLIEAVGLEGNPLMNKENLLEARFEIVDPPEKRSADELPAYGGGASEWVSDKRGAKEHVERNQAMLRADGDVDGDDWEADEYEKGMGYDDEDGEEYDAM